MKLDEKYYCASQDFLHVKEEASWSAWTTNFAKSMQHLDDKQR